MAASSRPQSQSRSSGKTTPVTSESAHFEEPTPIGGPGEILRHFDTRRREFAPYGFTCEVWEPRPMQRPDRHEEIEINFLDRGTLTYLIGGERVTLQPRRIHAFWAAVPHQIVAFDKVNFYYVVTVPFGWVLQWGLPEPMMTALTQGKMVTGTNEDHVLLDRQLFEQWHHDVEHGPSNYRDIVVLELRARLLRLAHSMSKKADPAAETVDPAKRQQTNLEKAEAMACFVARQYTTRLQIKDIAECVELHPDYAATLFRKTFGTTLNALITRHRVAHAQRQLVTSDERIVNIAHDSGFESLSRFNRAFKQIAGGTKTAQIPAIIK